VKVAAGMVVKAQIKQCILNTEAEEHSRKYPAACPRPFLPVRKKVDRMAGDRGGIKHAEFHAARDR